MMYSNRTYPPGSDQSDNVPVPPDKLNVLIAYPKALTGRLIADSLSRDRNFNVAAHVSSLDGVMAFIANMPVHILLVGTSLVTANDGLDVLHRIRASKRNIPAVLLLEHPDSQVVIDAFHAGAKGVFCMSINGYELLSKCLRCVHEGQIWATAQELNWVLDSFHDSIPASQSHSIHANSKLLNTSAFSPVEEHIVNLLADGRSNREIARILSLSQNTIKKYLSHIFVKVGVSGRKDLLVDTLDLPSRVLPFDPRKRSPFE